MASDWKIPSFDWVSVGGGAAGYFGALVFANRCSKGGSTARVAILESASEGLSKVALSGGGRCNLTHACFDPKELVKNYPRGGIELLSVFSRFQPRDTMEWFETRGTRLKIEDDGRVFPATERSRTVIDLFERKRKTAGIQLHRRTTVRKIERRQGTFLLEVNGGEVFSADRVLMATGSDMEAWNLLRSLGHTIVPPVPSLFSFLVRDRRLHGASGLSFENVKITAAVGSTERYSVGPLLVTHRGLSGPAILTLSSLLARELSGAGYRARIRVDFLPRLDDQDARRLLRDHQERNGGRMLKNAPVPPFPARYWKNLLGALGVPGEISWARVNRAANTRIFRELREAAFDVTGKEPNKAEFVTAGGVDRKEVDFRFMESRIHPGLHLAGEILDIDGLTGGFNLQNAWSTAFVAASARRIFRRQSVR